ncbi:hypothetical protein HPB47_007067 [Ixodes persulcatus]|uniref:Uncharacterized protein n=1 Tax=Ixodes persulcatus TaxID=34615 RepID=A0AC60P8P6_IXOPE|nr:hypothetical protein HPB47_007067 [Ixodes persulcatus]
MAPPAVGSPRNAHRHLSWERSRELWGLPNRPRVPPAKTNAQTCGHRVRLARPREAQAQLEEPASERLPLNGRAARNSFTLTSPVKMRTLERNHRPEVDIASRAEATPTPAAATLARADRLHLLPAATTNWQGSTFRAAAHAATPPALSCYGVVSPPPAAPALNRQPAKPPSDQRASRRRQTNKPAFSRQQQRDGEARDALT